MTPLPGQPRPAPSPAGRRFLLIFLDGVGIGADDPTVNPFARIQSSLFPRAMALGETADLAFGGRVKAVDACLGVAGVPQSATGQSTLYTGVNTPAMLGYHLYAFPNQPLRALLARQNLLKDAQAKGHSAAFLNCYPEVSELLSNPDKVRLNADGHIHAEGIDIGHLRHFSVTTVMSLSTGNRFLGLEDLRGEKSVYQEYTNASLAGRGLSVPVWDEKKAGSVLAAASADYTVSTWEYFRTDMTGHEGNLDKASELATRVETLVRSLLEHIDLSATTVVLSSDHGNLEDAAHKGHTANPVPCMVWGPGRDSFLESCTSIADITPTILRNLDH